MCYFAHEINDGNMNKIDNTQSEYVKPKGLFIYKNGDLIFFNDFTNIKLPHVFRSDIYVIGLVKEGNASMTINGEQHELCPNDLFFCLPTNIMEGTSISEDFKCDCICVAPAYTKKIIPLYSNAWDIKILLEKNPVCTLQPEEASMYRKYYDLLCSNANLPIDTQDCVVDALMSALRYYMNHVMRRFIQPNVRPYTTGERHFKKFIELIEVSNPKNRNLGYYADKLHVTPKYLSGICKTMTGETASKLIAQYVTKDIDYLLKFSPKSIKEIAHQLNFPTLSFFGRYVKKHLGMAPKELREAYRKRRDG